MHAHPITPASSPDGGQRASSWSIRSPRGIDVAGVFVLLGAVFAWDGFHGPAWTSPYGLIAMGFAVLMIAAGTGRIEGFHPWLVAAVAPVIVITMLVLEGVSEPHWPTAGFALSLAGALGGFAVVALAALRELATARTESGQGVETYRWPGRLAWAIVLWLLYALIAWVVLSPLPADAGDCDRDCAFFQGLSLFMVGATWLVGMTVLVIAYLVRWIHWEITRDRDRRSVGR